MNIQCPTCCGKGYERHKFTQPQMNTWGWYREATIEPWYRRPCERCQGDGMIETMRSMIPITQPKPPEHPKPG